MAVTRYYNPVSEQWEPIGISIPGPKGNQGPEGDIGPPGTQVYYESDPPPYPIPNLGDLWIDPNTFVVPENELPEAGTTGQALVKASDTNYDVAWGNAILEGDARLTDERTPVDDSVTVSKLNGTVSGIANDFVALDGTGGLKAVDSGAYAPASGQYPVNTVAASGATETLPSTFPAHNVTMDQSCTFTFGAPTSDGHTFTLRLAGAFTPTFPASVVWDGGTAPTYATPSVYAFTTLDGGTSWIGSLVASALA